MTIIHIYCKPTTRAMQRQINCIVAHNRIAPFFLFDIDCDWRKQQAIAWIMPWRAVGGDSNRKPTRKFLQTHRSRGCFCRFSKLILCASLLVPEHSYLSQQLVHAKRPVRPWPIEIVANNCRKWAEEPFFCCCQPPVDYMVDVRSQSIS